MLNVLTPRFALPSVWVLTPQGGFGDKSERRADGSEQCSTLFAYQHAVEIAASKIAEYDEQPVPKQGG